MDSCRPRIKEGFGALACKEQTRTLAANTVFGMMSALGVAPRPAKVKKAASGHAGNENHIGRSHLMNAAAP